MARVSTSAINIYVNVIIREDVTMYLLSAMPVVGFQSRISLLQIVQSVSFSIKWRHRIAEVERGESETTQVRPRSKLNAKLKTHVLGVNQRGHGWIGSLYGYILSYSRGTLIL